MGYFAYAQYDVLGLGDCRGTSCLAMTTKKHFSLTLNMPYFPLYVILSMSSEQTCLQGFANDDIHKALAFLIKNAENDSFNASALSAE